jgi:hypothetical protein
VRLHFFSIFFHTARDCQIINIKPFALFASLRGSQFFSRARTLFRLETYRTRTEIIASFEPRKRVAAWVNLFLVLIIDPSRLYQDHRASASSSSPFRDLIDDSNCEDVGITSSARILILIVEKIVFVFRQLTGEPIDAQTSVQRRLEQALYPSDHQPPPNG